MRTVEYGRWQVNGSGDCDFASPDGHAQMPSLDGCVHVLTTWTGAHRYPLIAQLLGLPAEHDKVWTGSNQTSRLPLAVPGVRPWKAANQ